MSGIGPISETPGVNMIVGPIMPAVASATGLTIGLNNARLSMFSVQRPVQVSSVKIWILTASGNIDLGIYDAAGTRLASTGTTVCPAAGATATVNLTAAITLLPGQAYYAAFAADNATVAPAGIAGQTIGNQSVAVAASFPLPASVSVAAGFSNRAYLMAFV